MKDILWEESVPYFNYHATAKKLIAEGRLKKYYLTEQYRKISPALVLVFDDETHPVMPIREERWEEYEPLLRKYEKEQAKRNKSRSRDIE